MKNLNILLYCNLPEYAINANTIVDHIEAFSLYSMHKIFVFSRVGSYPNTLDLSKFDVLVIHYSSSLLNPYFIPAEARKHIADFHGLKVLFIQDEYRQINYIHKQIIDLGIDILFTCIPECSIEAVYPSLLFPNLRKVNVLTGYISQHLLNYPKPLITNRALDVGYRARKLPYWYGKLAQEKWQIVDGFIQHTIGKNLCVDLSYDERKRVYGEKWLQFCTNCKTMLGVESGTSIMDFTGELEQKVDKYQMLHPSATFAEVSDTFSFAKHEEKIYINQISPRCFEAIALKTVLILFEGNYSNILQENRHYIPLKKDFSNINDVLRILRDPIQLQHIADVAYQEIALKADYAYQTAIKNFDTIINEEFSNRGFYPAIHNYSIEQFNNTIKYNISQKIYILIYDYLKKLWLCSPQFLKQIIKVTISKLRR